MPKLSPQCLQDVKRYVGLRYSHWTDKEQQTRISATVRALKRKTVEEREHYSAQVAEFFLLNKKVLDNAASVKQQLDNREVMSLLEVPDEEREYLIRKHHGNINAVMDEVRGNYH